MEDQQNARNTTQKCENIHIVLQSPTGKIELSVGGDCTAKQLKAGLALRMDVPEKNIVLIHCGRVLEEAKTVRALQGEDGTVEICALQRPSVSDSESVSSPSLQTEEAPTPTSPLFLVEGLSDNGPGLFSTLQRQMESQLSSDPGMMHRVLGSSLVQSTLSTAGLELTRQLILSNPQIQQLIQTNPELEEGVYNSDIITQVLELVRNPDMIMEVLKTEESVGDSPESINHYFSFPPRIPNNKQKSETTKNGCTDSKLSASTKAKISPQSTISTSMQSLLEQVSFSPGLMETLLSGPYVNSLLQCLSHNPELAAQMLLSHPLLSENPQLQQHMRQHLPLLLQQMQSPELLSAMLNPKAVEALLQIQQGLQTLAKEAPALVPPSVFGNSGTNLNAPDNNKEQQFVQQMLQALANTDLKDLDQLNSVAFEDR